MIIGIAIGKTLISSASGVPSIASRAFLAALGAALEDHVMAMKKSMIPPAMRKLARLIPGHLKQRPPEHREEHQDRPGDERASGRHRSAMRRRSAPVRLAKIGAQPGRSMITRNVTSAEPNSSIIGLCRVRSPIAFAAEMNCCG